MIPLALPSVAPPIVRPFSVTVMTVLATRVEPVKEMAIIVDVGVAAVAELPLITTTGVALVAMNPCGYMSEMLLPEESKPPEVVVNENVTADALLSDTRSDPSIKKVVPVT